jgi:hypothetical protein
VVKKPSIEGNVQGIRGDLASSLTIDDQIGLVSVENDAQAARLRQYLSEGRSNDRSAGVSTPRGFRATSRGSRG